jgi:energy-coupling factor transport system substrate-specific component
MSGMFSTRVIALMPVAIAINIVLGYTVQTVLKLPIYLDSIGTILVGVLAGPIPGALTGVLTNLIWQYAPGIGGGTIGPFAITAGVIGLLAGLWGMLGVYKPRPATGRELLLAAVVAAALVVLIVLPIINNPAYTDPDIGGYPDWVYTAAIAIAAIRPAEPANVAASSGVTP